MALALLVINSAAPMVMVIVAVAMAVLNDQVTLVAHLAIAMFELLKPPPILRYWMMICLRSLPTI